MRNEVYKYTKHQILVEYSQKSNLSVNTVNYNFKGLQKFLNIQNINTHWVYNEHLMKDKNGNAISLIFDNENPIDDDGYCKFYSDDDRLIIFAWLDEFKYDFIKLFPMDSPYAQEKHYKIPSSRLNEKYTEEHPNAYKDFSNRMQILISLLQDGAKKKMVREICESLSVFDRSLLEDNLDIFSSFAERFESTLKETDPIKQPELRLKAENDWSNFLSKIKIHYKIDHTVNGEELFPYERKHLV